MKLSEAITRFESYLQAEDRSPHTINSYIGDLRLLAAWLDDDPGIGDIKPDCLVAFVASDRVRLKADGRKKAPGSVNKVRASLRSFFRHLVDMGHLSTSPARVLRLRPADNALPAVLAQGEQERLLKTVAAGEKAPDRRDRVMAELLLGTGIRLASLVDLDISDVRLDEGRMVIQAKGGRQQKVFLRTDLRVLLREHIEGLAAQGIRSGPLFRSSRGTRISRRQVQVRLKGWVEAAGIEKPITVHSMRHSFGSRLYAKTKDLRLVQQALGHRSVTTAQIYTHLVDGALEAAIEGLG